MAIDCFLNLALKYYVLMVFIVIKACECITITTVGEMFNSLEKRFSRFLESSFAKSRRQLRLIWLKEQLCIFLHFAKLNFSVPWSTYSPFYFKNLDWNFNNKQLALDYTNLKYKMICFCRYSQAAILTEWWRIQVNWFFWALSNFYYNGLYLRFLTSLNLSMHIPLI